MFKSRAQIITCLSLTLLMGGSSVFGQDIVGGERTSPSSFASHIIIPQSRAFSSLRRQPQVQIAGVNVSVEILEQVATTTMDIALHNPSSSRLEAEMVVPVPEHAVVRGLDFEGNAKEPTAKLLARDEARRVYDSIVAQVRDPALLEFLDYNLIRTSVFPVEANGTQKVRLIYETILPSEGNRIDYVLPRSESLDYQVPWQIDVRIKSKHAIATVYSPTHTLETAAGRNAKSLSAKLAADAKTEPGPFRLSYLLKRDAVTASLMAYPDGKESGYFLMLAGLPQHKDAKRAAAIQREVTLRARSIRQHEWSETEPGSRFRQAGHCRVGGRRSIQHYRLQRSGRVVCRSSGRQERSDNDRGVQVFEFAPALEGEPTSTTRCWNPCDRSPKRGCCRWFCF